MEPPHPWTKKALIFTLCSRKKNTPYYFSSGFTLVVLHFYSVAFPDDNDDDDDIG